MSADFSLLSVETDWKREAAGTPFREALSQKPTQAAPTPLLPCRLQ